MEVRQSENGHEKIGACREGAHDDLVLAVALAVWHARKRKKSGWGRTLLVWVRLSRALAFMLRCGPRDHELLVTERDHWIDSCCPPRGQIRCEHSHDPKQHRRAGERQRIH